MLALVAAQATFGFGAVLNWIVAALTAILLVGTLAAVVRANLAKAQVEALRGDRDDLLKRVQILEDRAEEAERKLGEEFRARQVLEKVVTGREQLDQIMSALITHDHRVDTVLSAVHDSSVRMERMHEEHEESAERRAKDTRDAVTKAEQVIIREVRNGRRA